MSLTPGTHLGPYEILSRLGAGGMGVAYRAHDSVLDRTVALKILNEDASGSSDLLLGEARAASALNHPGICTVHEVRREGGYAFIVMEFVDGSPLSQLIPSEGLPPDTVLAYGLQLTDALAHAHEHGVLHRDLKSANVIVTKDGRAKLVDFGLARRVVGASADAATKSVVSTGEQHISGTLAYIAPEVLMGVPHSVTSDVWSFGILLYEMSCGHLPFAAHSVFEQTADILRAPVPQLPAQVPVGLRTVIAKCLAKEPLQRYQTAREIHAALEAVDSHVTIGLGAVRPVPRRRVSVWWIAAGTAAVVLAVVGAGRFARRTAPRVPDRLIQVLSSDLQLQEPALSPDGTMIAYAAEDETEQIDLFVARVAGGGRIRLTNDRARESRPRFSPDGERIVFARRAPDGTGPDIGVVPTLGGQVSIVLNGGSQPVWSPDGQQLAFIRYADRGSRLVLATARADGSNVRDLVSGTGAEPFTRAPSWSPDGRLIAFIRSPGGVAGEIWVVNADGSGAPRRVSTDSGAVSSDEPAFSPDSRSLVHSSNRGGATNLWSVSLSGGAPVRLTSGPGPDESPTVDAHGRVAFINSRWRNELIVQKLGTSVARTLVRHSPYLWGPAFAPDGAEIAYSRSEVDGSWHVWKVGLDGGAVQQLTNTNRGEVYPRWTRDGASVVFHNWNTPRQVWSVPRGGGPLVALTTPADGDAAYGDISPDGKMLAYVATEGSEEHVYLRTLVPGSRRRLLRANAASLPHWSPDGKWIAFSPNRGYYGGVFIVRPDGTGERQLTPTGGWPVWWPDGRRISFATIRPDSSQDIRSVSVEDGRTSEPIPIHFNGNNFPADVSREWLATTNSVHVSSEIWVLQRQ